MYTNKDRNNHNHLLDSFKFLAAFAVMHLHTTLGNVGEEWSTVIRLACRWAVPFFFLSSGYYLAKKHQRSAITIISIKGNLVNLIGIFLIANLVYIAYAISSGYIWFHNDVKYLWIGSFWHLWFIGSMIFAYLLIWFVDEVWGRNVLYILGFLTLLACITISAFSPRLPLPINYTEIPRFMSGFAFMVVGIFLARLDLQKFNRPFIITLLILAIPITYIEIYLGNDHFRRYDIELSIGISLIAISIFILSHIFTVSKNKLSTIGKRHSLFIYLYHVLIFKILIKVFTVFNINPKQFYIFFPIFALIILLGTVYILEKKFGRVFDLLNGKLKGNS